MAIFDHAPAGSTGPPRLTMILHVTPTDDTTHSPDGRPRARGLGIALDGTPGPLNALTDVAGIQVGMTTLVEGAGPLVVGVGPVRTGVTAILPRGRAGVGQPCAAGWHSLNGNGEMTGTTWIEEAGSFNLPVVLSNTHAVGACHTGVIRWANRVAPQLARQWLLPVCAETWDGYLNDINGGHVHPEHVETALDAAAGGPVAEGSVGGGTGMNCYEFKGGNGTSSRLVPLRFPHLHRRRLRAGQFRFAGRTDRGRPARRSASARRQSTRRRLVRPRHRRPAAGAGSVIAIIATDAPLLPGQCKALARRVPLGLARTGTTGSHFSGDIFLAFSTADVPGLASAFPVGPVGDDEFGSITFVPWGRMDPLYTAVVQCVEEAVLNALVVNDDMTGRRRAPFATAAA